MRRRLKFLLGVLLLTGCASNVPEAVRLDVGEPLTVADAQAGPERLQGRLVRWGGEILAVHNRPAHSDLVVLRRGLFSGGEPRPDGGEAKRFIARLPGFVDPADFAPGQRITVVGKLDGVVIRPVGEFEYVHPLVDVRTFHRWARFQAVREPDWRRDPFYCDPWWPWGYRRPYCW